MDVWQATDSWSGLVKHVEVAWELVASRREAGPSMDGAVLGINLKADSTCKLV